MLSCKMVVFICGFNLWFFFFDLFFGSGFFLGGGVVPSCYLRDFDKGLKC